MIALCAYRHFNTRIADGVGIALDDMLAQDARLVEAYSYSDPSPATARSTRSGDRPTGAWIGRHTDGDTLADRLGNRPVCATATTILWDRVLDGGFALDRETTSRISGIVGALIGSPFLGHSTPDSLPAELVDLVERLTLAPSRIDGPVVDAARSVTGSDEATLEVIVVVAVANAIGRIANATGLGPARR